MPDYMFVADCHGLSSINPTHPKSFGMMDLYCRYNEQRRCIYGTLDLEEDVYEGIKYLMENGNTNTALNLIKQSSYRFPKSRSSTFQRWISMIPNSILDPYYCSPQEVEDAVNSKT